MVTLVPSSTVTSWSNGNGQTLTPHRIQTPKPIMIKLCTVDYVRDEHVTQNLCQWAVRDRRRNTWNIRPLFLFYFNFFPDSPTEVICAWILTHNGSKYALWHKEVPFLGPHDGRQHYGVEIPQNRQKWPSIGTFKPPRTASWRMTS